jgi:hypothetical protein
METWTNAITTSASTATNVVFTTYGYSGGTMWVNPTTTAPALPSPPAPKSPTALEWLDAEVDKVCALAR